jgi:hypothetical protein
MLNYKILISVKNNKGEKVWLTGAKVGFDPLRNGTISKALTVPFPANML